VHVLYPPNRLPLVLGHFGLDRGQIAARALGVRLETFEINTPKSLADAFAKITRARTDAILVSFWRSV
jgi:hypothetical protein